MNSILPTSATGFSDPKYWKSFFAQRKSPFEWYGDYESLSPVLEKYMKPSDKCLQIGCGNSQLASQLYDNGYRNIESVDIDESVINEQRRRNASRIELKFEQADASNLPQADEQFTVVVDKGTLDALLPPNANEVEKTRVDGMFAEVERVLHPGGRYLIVTLAQTHLIDAWIDYFYSRKQYILRTHKVENKASGFPMPVFVLIATKMRAAMPMNLPLEMWGSGAAKAERLQGMPDLKQAIAGEQELAQFINMCAKKLEQEVSISFEGMTGAEKVEDARYRLKVLDNPKTTVFKSFAVFLVPLGRECEWIFGTEKGRQELRAQRDYDRLVVVLLSRQHQYESIEMIKAEIGNFVKLLDMREKADGFDILSVGSVDVAKKVANGKSKVNGEWSVEEVWCDDRKLRRRLIFLSTMNLVQSEAIMKDGKKGKKVVDLDDLSCDFHVLMIAGMALSPVQPLFKNEVPMKVSILGLGGGLLASFILRQFKKCQLTAIELDEDVIKIAHEYFGLPRQDGRLNVRCMDALDYLEESKQLAELDCMFVDVSGAQDAALQCPPPQFVEEDVLQKMSGCLRDNGICLINLVTRDETVKEMVIGRAAKVFKDVSMISSEEDVNQVLVCHKQSANKKQQNAKIVNQVRKDVANYNDVCCAIKRIRHL